MFLSALFSPWRLLASQTVWSRWRWDWGRGRQRPRWGAAPPGTPWGAPWRRPRLWPPVWLRSCWPRLPRCRGCSPSSVSGTLYRHISQSGWPPCEINVEILSYVTLRCWDIILCDDEMLRYYLMWQWDVEILSYVTTNHHGSPSDDNTLWNWATNGNQPRLFRSNHLRQPKFKIGTKQEKHQYQFVPLWSQLWNQVFPQWMWGWEWQM